MNAKRSGRTTKGWRAFAKREDWLAFDRADYLGTKIILGIAAVGSVLFSLGAPVVAAVTNAPLPVSYTTEVTSGIEMPRGATHDGYTTVDLLLGDATTGERLAQALPGLIFAAMTLAIAWLLFQLLRDTQAKEPFTRRNVRRINTIAIIVGIGGTLVQIIQGFADNAILASSRLPDSSARTLVFELSFTPIPLVVMLVIALVGEVFRRGIALRADVEGLV
jgi:hypothetical protein